ncbi:hypothetical protein ACIQYL_22740 [Lysinibacillus xylanilyticus]|uniref:hypothetical protein n=1 Tax=Lysinibacillus xylanilyticus TaxID=582475 RepID=UPI0038161FA5
MCESAAAATDVFCAKAKRQRHDVGHSVVATERGVLRLSSFISADVFCTESVASGTAIWTPDEKLPKSAFISPPIEDGDICNYHFTFVTKNNWCKKLKATL